MQLELSPDLTRDMTPQRAEALIGELSAYVTEGKQALIQRSLEMRTRYVTVVLEDIYQTQNASAVIRTCDLLGIQDLHVIEQRNRFKVNKAVTQGASKWVDVYRNDSGSGQATESCLTALREKGYTLAGMMPGSDALTPQSLPLDRPVALLFGTEETGLSKAAASFIDFTVHVPMFGFSQSYNLSVCVAMALQSLTTRLHASELPWRLDAQERLRLKLRWYAKSAANGAALLQQLMAASTQMES